MLRLSLRHFCSLKGASARTIALKERENIPLDKTGPATARYELALPFGALLRNYVQTVCLGKKEVYETFSHRVV